MEKVGRLGRQMMFRSCTVQTNLDFASEADMVKKFRVGIALQPIVTALFAASPFAEGRLNGFLSYRGHIWSDTDPDRTGMLPFVFEDGMGFERYAKYALDVPMYFVYRDGKYIDASGQSVPRLHEGQAALRCRANCRRTKDWEDHLTTIFPEVRLKTYPGNARRRFWAVVAPLCAAGVLGRHSLLRRRARSGVEPGEELDGGRPRSACAAPCRCWA